jgi:hypothetical protein
MSDSSLPVLCKKGTRKMGWLNGRWVKTNPEDTRKGLGLVMLRRWPLDILMHSIKFAFLYYMLVKLLRPFVYEHHKRDNGNNSGLLPSNSFLGGC